MAARIEGLNRAARKLNNKLRKVRVGTAEAVRDAGLDVLGHAVADAPVDKGDLRRSGSLQWGGDVTMTPTIEVTKSGQEVPAYDVGGAGGGIIARGAKEVTKEGRSIEILDDGKVPDTAKPVVTIGFSVPYAAAQHEHVEYDHPGGGKAKYLQGALTRARLIEQIREKAKVSR